MNELPKIINIPFDIKIGAVEFKAVRASLRELALLSEYEKKLKDAGEEDYALKQMVYSVKLCMEKAYPGEAITEEYVTQLLPIDILHGEEFTRLMEKLGFLFPTEPAK